MNEQTLAVILAGGIGSRLAPLTADRAKPSVPFGGKYRIIDFTLTNCLHSGLRRVLLLTQYKSHSLHKHIRDGWSVFNPELGEYITTVPAQMRTGDSWYKGTADALYQNLYLLERSGADYIVVLPGDHIYRMDYAPMVKFHKESGAELTIACMNVPLKTAKQFGVMSLDDNGLVTEFIEKPDSPQPDKKDPNTALASMGIYVFNTKTLLNILEEDHNCGDSDSDFGKDIIPKMIASSSVYGYGFGSDAGRVTPDKYWRDVGTLDAFYQANMDLLNEIPPMNLYQSSWPVRTYAGQYPPARTVPGASGSEGITINSIISSGTVISGATAQHSILFNNVFLGDESSVYGSLLFEGVRVGKGSQLNNCIIDKDVCVPDGEIIGFNQEDDRARFTISENGIVVVPKGYDFG